MTIANENRKDTYSGNGATTLFNYNFKIFKQSELKVTLRNTLGVEVTLALATHYSISGAGNPSGSITMITSPAIGETLTITRNIIYDQQTDLRNQGAWLPEVVEDEFDKSRMIDLQQREELDRALKFPVSTSVTDFEFPDYPSPALKLTRYKADGKSLELVTPADVGFTTMITPVLKQGSPIYGVSPTTFGQVDSVKYCGAYADFETAVATIGATVSTLVITELEVVSNNVLVPSNLSLVFQGQGQLSINTGVVVTIDGSFIAPMRKVITVVGSENAVIFSVVSSHTIFPDWWGFSTSSTGAVNKAALQRAIDAATIPGGGLVQIRHGIFLVDVGVAMKSGVVLMGSGYLSVLKIPDNHNVQDNLVKCEAISDFEVRSLRVDGNRSNQTQTNFGIYSGGSSNGKIIDCWAQHFSGDGIHVYDSDRMLVSQNYTTDNFFHGIEIEQTRDSVVSENYSYNNLRHGLFIFEGEVGASGSINISVLGNFLGTNAQYGLAIQGKFTERIVVVGNTISRNLQYGFTFFDAGQAIVFSSNTVTFNSFHGGYIFKTKNSMVTGNLFIGNSQAGAGLYSEILLDGDASGRPVNNLISGNRIQISSGIKAAYGIKENTSLDGPTYAFDNLIDPGTVATMSLLHSASQARNNFGHKTSNSGVITLQANGVATNFLIPHGLYSDPEGAVVTAGSPDARGDYYIQVDPTNITVVYNIAPIAGTNNIILRWQAERRV